jgi:hypothetical protein
MKEFSKDEQQAWNDGYDVGQSDAVEALDENLLTAAPADVLWVWEREDVQGNLAKFAAAWRLVVLAEAKARVSSAGLCSCASCLRPVEQIDLLMEAEAVR